MSGREGKRGGDERRWGEVVGERGLEWDVGVGDDRQDVGRKRRESTMRCQC